MEHKTIKQFLPNISYSVLIWFSIFFSTLVLALSAQFVPLAKNGAFLMIILGSSFIISILPYVFKKQTDLFNKKCSVCGNLLYSDSIFFYKMGSKFVCESHGKQNSLKDKYILPSLYEKRFRNELPMHKRVDYLNGKTIKHKALDLEYALIENAFVGKYMRVCQTVQLSPDKLKDHERGIGLVLLTDKKTLEQEVIKVQNLKEYMLKEQKDNYVKLLVECKVNHLMFWEAYFIEMFNTYDEGKNKDSGSYEYFTKEEVKFILNSRRATL